MFRVVSMVLADILVLERHLYDLTTRLAEFGNVELIPTEEGAERQDEELAKLDALIAAPLDILRKVGVRKLSQSGPLPERSEAELIISRFLDTTTPLYTQLSELRERSASLEETLSEVRVLGSLEVEINSLANFEHVVLHYGTIPPAALASLSAAAANNVIILPLGSPTQKDERQTILAASSRVGRFSLETLLGEHNYQEANLPDIRESGVEFVRALENENKTVRKSITTIEDEIDTLIQKQRDLVEAALLRLQHERTILKVISTFPHTESTARIRCWVPRPHLASLTALVDKVSEGSAVIETLDPKNLSASERSAGSQLSVPVILRNSSFFKPFESLIANYGYPAYGEIEPTPLVAIGFVLMFGVMFGDLGQGLVLLFAGAAMALRKRFSPAIRQAGVLVASAGVSAAFFGLVFGSFFCLEGVIHPLWHEPLKAFDNILVLFAATVTFGVLWISTGLLCNIANKLLFRDWAGMFLGKIGLAGLAFYWGALIPVVLMASGDSSSPGLATILISAGIPLLFVVCSEPLERLFRGQTVFPHGVGTWAIEALIEGIDTVTWFFGNTFSFVRIGAFALAHGGLSLAVIEMTKLGGGGLGSAVVFIGGNLLIIVLEGMVVTIQTLRLEYYEFFSKFYSGSGKPFVPFRLDPAGLPVIRKN